MNRILVVSPHPDDAEIGMGGAMFRMKEEGDRVTLAVCAGPGDLTMVHSGQTIPFEQRRKEQEAAAQVLGCGVEWLDLAPASRFDTVPQANFVSAFDRLFKQFDQVYLPLPSYNADHRIVFEAGLAAFRPGKLDKVGLFAYEQACSQCLGEPGQWPWGRRYIGLTAYNLRAKKSALEAHESQIGARGDTIYGPVGIEALARLRGLEIGVPLAEMVYLLRERV